MRYFQPDFWRDVVDAFLDAWDNVQNYWDCDRADREVCVECGEEIWNDPDVPPPGMTPCKPLNGCPPDTARPPGVKAEIIFAPVDCMGCGRPDCPSCWVEI